MELDGLELPPPARIGNLVHSGIADLGGPPHSFASFAKLPATPDHPITVGFAAKVLEGAVAADHDVERFFSELGVDVAGRGHFPQEIEVAASELVESVVADYRMGFLYRRYEHLPHYLYGTVTRYFATPNPDTPSRYHDSREHVDFVPPEDPCFGYFGWDDQPTVFHENDYFYEGPLHTDYRRPDHPTKYSQLTKDMWRFEATAGRGLITPPDGPGLWRTTEARTLLHRSDIRKEAFRTFARFFVGPKVD